MKPWEEKAHKIISELCLASYAQANVLPNGRLRKKHVPYSVPNEARFLVDCLKRQDEHAAKGYFISRAFRSPNDSDPA